jgi:hypothetical protein
MVSSILYTMIFPFWQQNNIESSFSERHILTIISSELQSIFIFLTNFYYKISKTEMFPLSEPCIIYDLHEII